MLLSYYGGHLLVFVGLAKMLVHCNERMLSSWVRALSWENTHVCDAIKILLNQKLNYPFFKVSYMHNTCIFLHKEISG